MDTQKQQPKRTRARRTTKDKLSSTGLLSALPWASRAPTPAEVDLLLADWGRHIGTDNHMRRQTEIAAAELSTALTHKFGESELVMTFAVCKVTDIIKGLTSGSPAVCLTDVMSVLMVGLMAGVRLGLLMERNDRAVSDGLSSVESSSASSEVIR